VVFSGEKRFGQELTSLRGAELVGPGNAGGRIGAGTGAVEFRVPGLRSLVGAAPYIPSLRDYIGGQFGADVDDPREWTPGTAEADGIARGCCLIRRRGRGDSAGDFAVEDDVAGGLIGRGARLRGQVAGAVRVNFGVVEDCRSVAEDEVDATLDVGIEVVLAAVVGEERVLVAEKAAVLEDGAIGADRCSDGLAGVAAVFSKVMLSASNPAPLISAVSVKKVPPACLALRLLVMTTSEGDFPVPIRVMLVWF